VIPVAGGQDALSALAARSEPVDLLLSDVVMPDMSGPQLVLRVAALYPQVKTFFMSGYAEGTLGTYCIPTPESGLIEKPFTAEQLLRKVREVLDSE
jgi:two-component system, cell cycle sensor histidine kinase and response regulator CckA